LENADHIIVLDDGDVLAQGTYKELNDKGLNLSSYLDTSSPINIEKKRSSKKKTEAFEKKIPKVINSINSESLNNLKELEKLIPTTPTNTSEVVGHFFNKLKHLKCFNYV
jgi:ABC-type multidrug transport system ATPase subunit